MRNFSIPQLEFSTWYKWENRNQYPLKKYPGVYLISISVRNNLEGNKPQFKEVVYIGMTNSQGGLAGRWNQFNSSIRGKNRHSGGNTIYKEKGYYENWEEWLYVAAMGVECNVKKPKEEDYMKMGCVAFLEYEAFAKYYSEAGSHTKYNKK